MDEREGRRNCRWDQSESLGELRLSVYHVSGVTSNRLSMCHSNGMRWRLEVDILTVSKITKVARN